MDLSQSVTYYFIVSKPGGDTKERICLFICYFYVVLGIEPRAVTCQVSALPLSSIPSPARK